MQTYIGTKHLKARPMSLGDYNAYRGWPLPANEDGSKPGYLVEYLDGGQPNMAGHDGYVSWSPADVFTKSYRAVNGMTFGLALEALKEGLRVARAGWNGKGMWIVLMTPMDLPAFNDQTTQRKVNDRTAKWIGKDTALHTDGYLAMWTAQGTWQPGWNASQADMLAEDWCILDDASVRDRIVELIKDFIKASPDGRTEPGEIRIGRKVYDLLAAQDPAPLQKWIDFVANGATVVGIKFLADEDPDALRIVY